MAFGKWLSVGMGLASALLVGVLLHYAGGSSWPRLDNRENIVTAAIAVGVVLGLMHWLMQNRFDGEVRRFRHYVEALGRSEPITTPYKSKLLSPTLASSVDQTVGMLRARVAQLVSQRRELEVQLRISDAERRHAQAILNSITDLVIVTDAFNEVILVNESAARTFGFEMDMARRRPVDQIIDDAALVKMIKDAREGGDVSLRRNVEHKLVRNTQSCIYNVTLACITGTVGQQGPMEISGVVTILRDITREKEISEMKSDFVSNVSHELRTPLSSIKAYMEMLVDGEANDEQTRAEFYNIIQGETNRLSRLIDNILNISRIESGVVKVQREHVSLPAQIKEVIDVMQPQARAKQIELVEVPTPLFFQVFADKDMIYQALLNLVSNSIKYTPNGGKVTISITVDEHDRMVRVHVSDTGVGIPPDDLPHLFEKFYRVADHKKMAKGTGLGLNLVKHIIETVHGGHVSVSSQIGKGSTFTFALPMVDHLY